MEPSKLKVFACILGWAMCLVLFSVCNCFSDQNIRVAVLLNVNNFDLDIRGRYQLLDEGGRILKEGRRFHPARVSADINGIKIGQDIFGVKKITVSSSKDIILGVQKQNKRYRGEIDIIVEKDKTVSAVNVLDLETYTKGVLYHEVSHRWPLEAIKAQAVATRTYALYQILQNKSELFDVKSDIYSQVYGGKSAERYRTSIASNRTRGQILIFEGKVLPAYFHATCGGRTEDVKELWNHNLLPLAGKECDYCVLAPYYRWTKNFRNKDIQDLLNKNGYALGLIENIEIVERTDSGRVKMLKIRTRDGKTSQIAGKKFRDILGPNLLKSNFYEINMKGYFFDVLGKGWGHGVGMCQWGALGMAQQRIPYKEILQYYYPGTQIETMTDESLFIPAE